MIEIAETVSAEQDRRATGRPVLGSALGVTLAVVALGFWPPGLEQFLLPKRLVLLVAAPALAATMIVMGGAGRALWRADRRLVPLAAATVLWFAIVPLPRAANPALHALGALELLLLAVLGAAAAVAGVREGEGGARRVLAGAAVGGGVVAALAVLQGVGADPLRAALHLVPAHGGRWRVLTTTGNPGWTAELLAVTAPAGLAWALRRAGSDTVRRLRVALVLLAAAAGVAATGSRAGALALVLGLAVMGALGGGRWGRRLWRPAWPLAALAGVLLLSAAMGTWRWRDVRPLTGRAGLWAAGAFLVAERPLGGWGGRHTQKVLPMGLERVAAGIDPGLRPWLPRLIVDRVDDDWLQLALEGGLPAALLTFAVWLRSLLLAWRRARRSSSATDAAVAASLAVIGLLSFVSSPLHTPATAAVFWALAGLAGAGRRPPPAGAGEGPPRPRRRERWAAWLAPAVAVLAAILVLRADTAAGKGRRLLAAGRPGDAVRELRAAVRTLPWRPEGWKALAAAELEAGHPAQALVAARTAGRWTASERLWAVEVRALEALGRPDLARRRLAWALRRLPMSPVLRALVGREDDALPGTTAREPEP